MTLLLRAARRQYGLLPGRDLLRSAGRNLLAAGLASALAGAGLLAGRAIEAATAWPAGLLPLAAGLVLAIGGYLLAARLLGSPELSFVLGLLRSSRRRSG